MGSLLFNIFISNIGIQCTLSEDWEKNSLRAALLRRTWGY